MRLRPVVAALPLLLATAPAYADAVTVTGLTCGMTAAHDSTGIFWDDPTSVHGVLAGGPLRVSAGEPVHETTLECEVVNRDLGTESRVYRWTQAGDAAVLAEVLSLSAEGPDPVELCTRLSWATASSAGTRDLGCVAASYSDTYVPAAGQYTVVPSPVLE